MPIGTVLIADDDPVVRKLVRRALSGSDIAVLEAANGEEAIDAVTREAVDVVLLDVMMGMVSGLDVIESLRARNVNTPILMLSGRTGDEDKVMALGLGADDYITKPFSPMVLCAKVKAVMRRFAQSEQAGLSIVSGPFRYQADAMRLYKNAVEIPLTVKEGLLIRQFMQHPRQVLSMQQLYAAAWGDAIVDDNTVMVYVRKLRTKIEENASRPRHIITARGIGYRFEP